jgi:inositol-phosphate phosphatase/L-galactose 1-phosphate phosphatase/histidinol-phosphatase
VAAADDPPPNLGALTAFACELADSAGAIVLDHFRAPGPVTTKPDGSPVTEADRIVESAMRDAIQGAFPDHGILGEEFGETGANSDYVWVLDPIDGTRSFISGKPVFATLIGLGFRGKPVLGVIDQAITGERWVGAAGAPTTLNGTPAKVRDCAELAQATAYTSGPEWFNGPDRDAFDRLHHEVLMTLYSADAYAFGLLASGYVDVAFECGLKPYDYWALVPVIQGAGGIITDWAGAKLTLDSVGKVLAAGDKSIHRRAIAILST